MSDGNFNRALLPSTPYQSGLKMGRQIALKQALDALRHILSHHTPALNPDEVARLEAEFRRQMGGYK